MKNKERSDGSINVTVDGVLKKARIGDSLSEITKGHKPCGGRGVCGKCKVLADGNISEISEREREILAPDEILRGIRLSCLAFALGECNVHTLKEGKAEILTEGKLPNITIDPTFSKYGVAVDIGTTTMVAGLYSASGVLLSQSSMLNPQGRFGADVISRVEAALSGEAQRLADAVRNAIDFMIEEMARDAGIESWEIDGAVITANTVMLSLLAMVDVEPFSHAPFEAKELFGRLYSANELGLKTLEKDTKIYIPPCIHAFVGADTTCALLATEADKQNGVTMLADIGTNGEMAIYADGKLTVCSTAAGPAFEGVGISCGMRGAVGAIDKVYAVNGELSYHAIGEIEPVGLCGSGLVDAVSCMLSLELIDESGYFEDEIFRLSENVSLCAKDIRMLQLAKSAICSGLMTLLDKRGIAQDEVDTLFVAGGFGTYLNKSNASRIGLLPKHLSEASAAVGNAAFSGASMLLLSRGLLTRCNDLVYGAEVLDLAGDKCFAKHYMNNMILDYVE